MDKKKGGPVSRILYLAVSIIYLSRESPRGFSDLPPNMAGPALALVYMVLQLVGRAATRSPGVPVGSYPACSPLSRERDGCFLSRYLALSSNFPLGSTMPCVVRTFLSPSRDSDRTGHLFLVYTLIHCRVPGELDLEGVLPCRDMHGSLPRVLAGDGKIVPQRQVLVPLLPGSYRVPGAAGIEIILPFRGFRVSCIKITFAYSV